MKKIIFFWLLFFSLFSEINYFAQGDNCSNALNLVNVSNYCSTSTFYTNAGSTASSSPNASCWAGGATEDVWFSFTAIGSNINISVDGTIGSMARPRIAIYSGNCASLSQIACNNGSAGSDLSQLTSAGFTIGTTYFIRISSTSANEGTFKLCVNNYTPPPIASADCGGAIRLCDKNPVSATGFSGGGSNSSEPSSNSCMTFGESNSIWYYWTCVTAGTLTFDITPADNSNDIDWVLYQLNGANPCSQSGNSLRCNVSAFLNSTGSTGINLSDLSINEQAGINPGDNAYCKFITMTAGTSYALLINNANGFDGITINWGGTGTFSIEPTFNSVAAICSGATLTALPTTSLNGVTGSWTPALNNTATTTYTFSPSPGICAATVTLPITVNPTITPTFNAVAAICSGATLSALPLTSLNGISGTWSPALNNTATTTYTFTPNAGQCGTTTTLTITVNPNIVPTFTAVSAICSGATLSTLPLTSLNGINGTWSPALNNTATTTYTFAPVGTCVSSVTQLITVNPNITPTFNAVTPICSGAPISPLVTTSLNGITGTWSPAINNSATTTYTFTPTAGQCATITTSTITINPLITPTFTAVNPICSGATLAALPTTSLNGIVGTWSPALNNTATTTYTFTPGAGQCGTTNPLTTITITVNPNIVPTFAAVNPICSGATLTALPTTSLNGITGTWSPALNNTATTTYTFAPVGTCVSSVTQSITVNPNVTPTFTAIAPICAGATLTALPTTSLNGITGTWSPALNNTATTTYTFTPTAGLCALTTTLSITVNPILTPTFNAVNPICSGATLNALPTSSLNGITGTWSPAINNTATTTYTYTPNAGQCGTTTTLTITVNPNVVPTFTAVNAICSGATLTALPLTSLNSINGTWSPALNNTATTTYTFTPNAGICATTANITITVNPIIAPVFTAITPICSGATLAALPLNSLNGISGTWSPAVNNTSTTSYTFTPTAGLCASTSTMSITVNPNLTPIITCGLGSASSVLFNWSALNGANSYDISYSVNGGIAQSGGNQTGLSFLLNGLNPADVVDLILTTNGSNCYLPGLGNCEAFDCILPTISSQPTNHTACEGNLASFTVVLSGGTSMQWQVSADNGLTFNNVIDAAVFSGSTTSTLSISDNTGLDGLIFQLVINEVNNLCPRTSNQAELIVNPYPVITALNNGPVCVGNQSDLSVNNVPGASFSWTGPNFSSFLQNPTINFTQTTDAGDYTVTSTLNGCASSSTTTLIVNVPTPVSITQVGSFCQSALPVFLTADVLGGTWSGSGITDNILGVFDPSQAGDTNLITYTLSAGCGGSATSTIFVKTDPTALFSVSETVLDPYFPIVSTTNLSTNATNFIWHFDDDSISTAFEATHKYDNIPQSYTITLLAFNEAGCSDSTKIIVNIPELLLYFVPNSFTPNGDELNNTFLPVFTSGFDPFNYHLEIFNRWGELIFESFDAKIGWDGTFKELALVEEGTYVWKISFGVKSIGDSKTLVGDVTITK